LDATLAVFALCYLGMLLGGLPGLALDRTGVALLAAIALVALGEATPAQAWQSIDVPTVALLFGLMIVSAQLELAGFYEAVTRRTSALPVSPPALLAAVVAVAGLLSAVLANDIVCLAMAPLLVEGCARRRLDPVPYLLALCAAANVGSAATLIGNPQNMLIGEVLGLDFARYLAAAAVPAALGLAVVWAVVAAAHRGRWEAGTPRDAAVDAAPWRPWQAAKGIAAVLALAAAFLATDWPREVVALGAAGALLASRETNSRALLAKVDGQLLVLFIGLFVVHGALSASGHVDRAFEALRAAGVDPSRAPVLFSLSAVLSNLVSNVPATMLLLPAAARAEGGAEAGGALLALSSTLAGNFLLVGSIANLIVADQAARLGVRIGWREHARVGVPVTIATLAIAAAWLALR